MNLDYYPQVIYFSRHGQSEYNVQDRIGGDPDLSANGIEYAKQLNEFFQTQFNAQERKKIKIMTSTLKRTIQTASYLKLGVQPISMKCLDEINAGICNSAKRVYFDPPSFRYAMK